MLIRLSPSERFVLGTASGTRTRIALVHEVRRELQSPGDPAAKARLARFGFGDMIRYVFLLGFNRQPLLYTIGPAIAVLSYFVLVYQLFARLI